MSAGRGQQRQETLKFPFDAQAGFRPEWAMRRPLEFRDQLAWGLYRTILYVSQRPRIKREFSLQKLGERHDTILKEGKNSFELGEQRSENLGTHPR